MCPGGATCANRHDADNRYKWSSTRVAPDGGAFTDVLSKFNGSSADGVTTTGCYAGHCDWRLPTIEELRSVPWPGIPEFQADDTTYYCWSASANAFSPTIAWYVRTNTGIADSDGKTDNLCVRAVRSGS